MKRDALGAKMMDGQLGALGTRVFDTKLVKGPQSWDGTRATWRHWSEKLKGFIGGVSPAMLELMNAADGYLGPFPDAKGSDGLRTMKAGWDSWGHYHICLGCLLWHEATGGSDPVPLAIATKISQLMITTFPGSDPHKFFNQGSLEQNMAIGSCL